MKRYFIVSDVHSYYDEFKLAIDQKGFDINNENHVLVVCGDLFDRGNKSLDLYNFVRSIPEDRFVYIRGNHEDLLFDCFSDIVNNRIVSSHHISNGTLSTILQLSEIGNFPQYSIAYDIYCIERGDVLDKIPSVLAYIRSKCVPYYEIGDNILVHGWIPSICIDGNIYHARKNALYDANWRNASEEKWREARWLNGIDAWANGNREDGKTIICGHWHCSWGWSHIIKDRKEFPPRGENGWLKSFEPFVADGIVAIDGCTAYSGIVNCIVIDDE